mgnify:CR=1 FL=1
MSLKDQLKDQQKLAMLAKDKARLGAIRLLMTEIKQREVDTRIELNFEVESARFGCYRPAVRSNQWLEWLHTVHQRLQCGGQWLVLPVNFDVSRSM